MRKNSYEFSLHLDVLDEAAMRRRAVRAAIDYGHEPAYAARFEDPEEETIENCIGMILDPGSLEGCEIHESNTVSTFSGHESDVAHEPVHGEITVVMDEIEMVARQVLFQDLINHVGFSVAIDIDAQSWTGGVQVRPCKETLDIDGEKLITECDPTEASFFGVYGSRVDGTHMHIMDFDEVRAAEHFAAVIQKLYFARFPRKTVTS